MELCPPHVKNPPMASWKLVWNPDFFTGCKAWPLAFGYCSDLISSASLSSCFYSSKTFLHAILKANWRHFWLKICLFLFVFVYFLLFILPEMFFLRYLCSLHTAVFLNVTSSKSSCPKLSSNPSHHFSVPLSYLISLYSIYHHSKIKCAPIFLPVGHTKTLTPWGHRLILSQQLLPLE